MKKDSLDFRLNYYYHKYKDKPLPNSDDTKIIRKDTRNGKYKKSKETWYI